MALTRHVPIMWDTPSSWSRQGWDMNYFNPERQLDMLDREMRDLNMRSGLRDMNMSSDNQISNMKSEFDRWSSDMHRDRNIMPYHHRPMTSVSTMTPMMPMSSMALQTPSMSLQPSYDVSMGNMDREMRRMTDEMNRLFTHCKHLIPVDSQPDTWRTRENFLLENPIIHSRDGRKKFALQFDVRQFKPEEIMVKTSGKQLSVHARHEEKGDNKSCFREYNRQYVIPVDINPETLVSKLNRDGLLTIEAPLPEVEESIKLIPIEHK